MSNLDDAEVDRVFAGKVWGAWHLSEAAADLKLDFFLSTSSIASVWGSYGQTAYGAANAFLDGLSWRLREQGVSGVSVNFGPWAAGMADEEARAKLAKRGVRTLSPADALAGVADLLTASSEQGVAQGVVARIDWARFLPLYQQTGRRAFLAELEREVPNAVPATTASGKTQLVERLTNAPVQQRRKLMSDYLRDAVAEVTRVDPVGDPRGRRILRPRHGFADGRRIAAPHRAGRRQGDPGDAGDGLPASVRRGGLPARRRARAQRAVIEVGPVAGDSGDDPHRRADRDRRRVVPFPRRAQPGSVLGCCCPVVSMRSGKSRRTASTSTSSTTRTQTLRARPTRASADSWTESTDSIRSSSASLRAKPSGSSRSSG